MRPHPRFKVLRYRLPMAPKVAWLVGGRKQFDRRYSPAIRRMWGIGNYLGSTP